MEMIKPPWKLTRAMFLTEEELTELARQLDRSVKRAPEAQRSTAITDRLIVQCLAFSGLRNSEFCSLRVEDTIIRSGISAFEVCGTPRQDRTVFVPDSISRLLMEFVEDIRPQTLPDDVDPNDVSRALVYNERRRPYERTGLYRRVIRILTAAGFGDRASVQFLRHTYGYLAYKNSGGNLLFVQRQLGHAHPMVTSVYSEFVEEDYAQIADQIAVRSKGRRTP